MALAHDLESGCVRSADVSIEEKIDFQSLFLASNVLQGLQNAGFVRPSPVQLKAIPLGRCGFDIMVQAKSGTGKTCVLAAVALERVDVSVQRLQTLVVAPTREIAVQVAHVLQTIGSATPGLQVQTFIGGLAYSLDKAKIKQCHIAVGTPGRIKQLISDGHMSCKNVRLFALDEADKLLQNDFKTDISYIFSKLPSSKQIITLSATYPEELVSLLVLTMKNARLVRLDRDSPGLLGLRYFALPVKYHPFTEKFYQRKTEAVQRILSSVSFTQCFIFCNSQLRAQRLCTFLASKGWPTGLLTAAQEQKDRLESFHRLQEGKCRVLLATDLAARGLDAERVNLVINMDMPRDAATFLHRSGRAGRFGSKGLVIMLSAGACEDSKLFAEAGVKVELLPEFGKWPNLWETSEEKPLKLFECEGSIKNCDELQCDLNTFEDQVTVELPSLSIPDASDAQSVLDDINNETELLLEQSSKFFHEKGLQEILDIINSGKDKDFLSQPSELGSALQNTIEKLSKLDLSEDSSDDTSSTDDSDSGTELESCESTSDEGEPCRPTCLPLGVANPSYSDCPSPAPNSWGLLAWHQQWLKQLKQTKDYIQYAEYWRLMYSMQRK